MVEPRGQERMIEPVWGFAERVAKGINEYHRTDDEVTELAITALKTRDERDRLAAAVERVEALCEERLAETAEGLSASVAGEIQVSVLGATHHAYARVLAALEGSDDI